MKKNNQETFKSFIDKSNTTCRFIFITNQICKISNSIIDRCTQMRIPVLSKYDTAVLSNKILNKNNINKNKNQFIELIEDTSNNLNLLKFTLINILISGKYVRYRNKYKDIILSIPDLFKNNKFSNFIKLRDILINLLICNIQPDFIFYTIIEHYINSNIDKCKKRDILNKGAHYQYNCQSDI